MMGLSLTAVSLDLGLSYGSRTLADGEYKDLFGNGNVFCPELSINVFKGLTIGALLESGYSKNGEITAQSDLFKTSMKVNGFEVFAGYTLDLDRFHPFVRIGLGSYSYEQTFEFPSSYPAEVKQTYGSFKETKGVVSVGGGLKVDLVGGLYLGGQLRYVPMKLTITPAASEAKDIDLGGLRALVTVGYRFDFKKKE